MFRIQFLVYFLFCISNFSLNAASAVWGEGSSLTNDDLFGFDSPSSQNISQPVVNNFRFQNNTSQKDTQSVTNDNNRIVLLVKDYDARIAKYQEKIQSQDQLIQDQSFENRSVLDQLEKKARDLEAQKQKVQELTQSLAQAKEKQKNQEVQKEQYKKLLTDYESELTDYELEIKLQDNDLATQKQKVQELTQSLAQAKEKQKNQEVQKEQYKKLLTDYESELTDYELEIKLQDNDLATQKQKVQELTQSLAQAKEKQKNQVQGLKKSIYLYRKDVESLKQGNAKYLQEISDYKSKLRNLLSELSDSKSIHNALVKKYNQLSKARSVNLKRINELSLQNQLHEKKIEELIAGSLNLTDLIKEKVSLLISQKENLMLAKENYDKEHEKIYLDTKSKLEERLSILKIALEEFSLRKKDGEFFVSSESLSKKVDLENQKQKIENQIESLEFQMKSELEKTQFSYDAFIQNLESETDDWKFKRKNYDFSHQSSLDQVDSEYQSAYSVINKELNGIKLQKEKLVNNKEQEILGLNKKINEESKKNSNNINTLNQFRQNQLLQYNDSIASSKQSSKQYEVDFNQSIEEIKDNFNLQISGLKSEMSLLERKYIDFDNSYQNRKANFKRVLESSRKKLNDFLDAQNQLKIISQTEIESMGDFDNKLQSNLYALKDKVNQSIQQSGNIHSIQKNIANSVEEKLAQLDVERDSFYKKYNADKQLIMNRIKKLQKDKQSKINDLNTAYLQKVREFDIEISKIEEAKERLNTDTNQKILSVQNSFPVVDSSAHEKKLNQLNFEVNQTKRELSQIDLTYHTQESTLKKKRADKIRKLESDRNNFIFKINSFLSKLDVKKNQVLVKHKMRIHSINKDYRQKIRKLVLEKQGIDRRLVQLKNQEILEFNKLSSFYDKFGETLKSDFDRHQEFFRNIESLYQSRKSSMGRLYHSLLDKINNQIVLLENFSKAKTVQKSITDDISKFIIKNEDYALPEMSTKFLDQNTLEDSESTQFFLPEVKSEPIIPDLSHQNTEGANNTHKTNLPFDKEISDAIVVLENEKQLNDIDQLSWFVKPENLDQIIKNSDDFIKIETGCSVGLLGCLSPFYISMHEVRNDEFKRFNPEHNSGSFLNISLDKDNQPVVNVTFEQAQAYADWLSDNSTDGSIYRLPTESEWEYTALAGLQREEQLPWYQNPDIICQIGNVADASIKKRTPKWVSFACDDKHFVTAPVGSYLPNRYGIYDIFGNAWEMVCKNYSSEDQTYECNDSNYYIAKGGSWYSHPQGLKKHFRYIQSKGSHSPHIGFRLVKVSQ